MKELGAVLGAVAAAVCIPTAAVYAISRLGGWTDLARQYPLRGPFPQPKTRFGYGVFRGWVGYNGGLIVGSDSSGLYLHTMPVLLSFCHEPIFIPWSDVRSIEAPSGSLAGYYRLRFAKAPEVNFGLRPGTFAKIREDVERAGITVTEPRAG